MKDRSLSLIATSYIALMISCAHAKDEYAREDLTDSTVIVSRGIVSVLDGGEIQFPGEKDPNFLKNIALQDKAYADQEAYNNSWAKFGKDCAIGAAKQVGTTFMNVIGEGAYGIAKFAVAYTASEYVGSRLIDYSADAFAFMATPVLGPVALGAAATIKTANFVSDYIPGVREFKHAAVATATKEYILPGLVGTARVAAKHTPTVAKASYSGMSYLYNWVMS